MSFWAWFLFELFLQNSAAYPQVPGFSTAGEVGGHWYMTPMMMSVDVIHAMALALVRMLSSFNVICRNLIVEDDRGKKQKRTPLQEI